ncbi:hypothetical protein NDU88_004666 [Pleurodeles waltl]|uniref:Uncharacterized protein n=1 Tax=Pleurodeles waltl TaxID=8319 RepID=A0AAV7W9R6_PLEWA|nr:hypothetical protein NDU88_004666 [Pleurodeles waltl]
MSGSGSAPWTPQLLRVAAGPVGRLCARPQQTRRLPLGWGSAPDLEVLTARRTYGVCGDRCEGNWSLPSPCIAYPFLPARGEEGRETNPVVGHWGCLPIL